MKIIPVSSVGQGIGESGPPIIEIRSGGMPEKSQWIAASDRNTTSIAMNSSRMPL